MAVSRAAVRDGIWWVTGLVVVLAVGLILTWRFWDELHRSQDSISTTVRNLGLVIGGAIAILLSIWRSLVATRQTQTGQQGLLYERYQKAADMLGNRNLFVRLGGVYGLQALIDENPEKFYVSCMRLLCAFVRNPPDDPYLKPFSDKELTRFGDGIRLRKDVQAIMDLMRSRSDRLIALEKSARFEVDFRGADLRGSNLSLANLSGVDLRNSDLSGAFAMGANMSHVGLAGARLYKTILASADLTGTWFHEVDVSRTWFCGKSAILGQRFDSPATGIAGFRFYPSRARKHTPPVLGGVVLDAESGTPLQWDPSKGMGIEYISK